MKKTWAKISGYFKEAFAGVTWREVGGALRDTGRDVVTSKREALTAAIVFFASPIPGSIAAYLIYRLRLYRAKIGAIDVAPEPFLSDRQLAAISQGIRTAPKRVAKALWGATPVAMKTAGTAISLAGAGLSTYATIQVVRAPAIANYSVLKACNDAMRVKQPCTQAGATERAKSIHAQKHLGMFAGGGAVMAVGAGVFSLGGRRKK